MVTQGYAKRARDPLSLSLCVCHSSGLLSLSLTLTSERTAKREAVAREKKRTADLEGRESRLKARDRSREEREKETIIHGGANRGNSVHGKKEQSPVRDMKRR